MFSVQDIKELIQWVATHRVRGIEVERAGFRLKIDGVAPPEVVHSHSVLAAPAAGHSNPSPIAPAASALRSSAEYPAGAGLETRHAPPGPVPPDEEAGLHFITSPIVGTFYRAAGPDKEPFIKLGDHVAKGQVLCIVEAMKLMNEIESDVSGEIVRIFAQNVQPVEYGEKLFAVRPD